VPHWNRPAAFRPARHFGIAHDIVDGSLGRAAGPAAERVAQAIGGRAVLRDDALKCTNQFPRGCTLSDAVLLEFSEPVITGETATVRVVEHIGNNPSRHVQQEGFSLSLQQVNGTWTVVARKNEWIS